MFAYEDKKNQWGRWLFQVLVLLVITSLFGLAVFSQKEENKMKNKKTNQATVKIYDAKSKKFIETQRIKKSENQWKEQLNPLQYKVMRQKATERPFSGIYEKHHEEGVYKCAGCGLELFLSGAKFDSGCGWPSFSQPLADANIVYKQDNSLFQRRVEILCPRCDAHLGHVFNDGPPESTGLRYCVNSASLDFAAGDSNDAATKENENTAPGDQEKQATGTPGRERAIFAAGCFWGVEAAFRKVDGVTATTVGYTGGSKENPSYRDVCTGMTGHAEAVQVEYDPTKVSYEELLAIFWENHDPTTLNRQGPDVGTQYRSAIFYLDEKQQTAALASKVHLEIAGTFHHPIVTQILPASTFYPAEEYHQQYLEKKGLATCRIK